LQLETKLSISLKGYLPKQGPYLFKIFGRGKQVITIKRMSVLLSWQCCIDDVGLFTSRRVM